MRKKLCMIAAAVLTLAIVLTGCAKGVDPNQAAAVMDETNIPLGEVNLMLRYQQGQMETYYSSMFGSNIYQQDMDGSGQIYGETAKEGLMQSFQELYVLEAEAANYGVALTEEENAAITAAAKEFMADNADQNVQEAISASEETMAHLLQLLTLQDKMYDALTADVDTEVSDEEAAQKKVTYLYFSKKTTDEEGNSIDMTEDEVAALKETAQEILDKAKESKDLAAEAEAAEMTASTITFDEESSYFTEEVMEAANALGEGEYSDVIDVERGLYILQLDSLLDRDATDVEKESIVADRRDTLYSEKVEELLAAHTFELNEKALAKLTFERTYTLKVETETAE